MYVLGVGWVMDEMCVGKGNNVDDNTKQHFHSHNFVLSWGDFDLQMLLLSSPAHPLTIPFTMAKSATERAPAGKNTKTTWDML